MAALSKGMPLAEARGDVHNRWLSLLAGMPALRHEGMAALSKGMPLAEARRLARQ